jgi:hypothetical protein
MADLKIIQEKYASMGDEQLIYFAQHDSHDITTEAMALLKQEFATRGMNIADFSPAKNEPASEENSKPLMGQEYDIPVSLSGVPYYSIPSSAEEESTENTLAPTEETQLLQLIKKCESRMVINGVIFVVGLAVTLLTFANAQDKGGTYFVAWGAILFGGIDFFRAVDARQKCQSALKNIPDTKEELPE